VYNVSELPASRIAAIASKRYAPPSVRGRARARGSSAVGLKPSGSSLKTPSGSLTKSYTAHIVASARLLFGRRRAHRAGVGVCRLPSCLAVFVGLFRAIPDYSQSGCDSSALNVNSTTASRRCPSDAFPLIFLVSRLCGPWADAN
jgi:hypothetical protein